MYRKACPSCHGDVFTERPRPGEIEMACLQCGRQLTEQLALTLLASRHPALQPPARLTQAA